VNHVVSGPGIIKRRRVRAAIVAGAVVVTIGAAVAAYLTGSASASTAPEDSAAPVQDYWGQTSHSVTLGVAMNVLVPVMSMRLPAGSWVLRADVTIVAYSETGIMTCEIGDTANHGLISRRATVGIGVTISGVPSVGGISETGAVHLNRPDTIVVRCEHASLAPSGGSAPYIDPKSTLWAHRSGELAFVKL
jgi:hypothetical protein